MKTFLIILIVLLTSLTAYGQPQWIVYNTGNSGLPENFTNDIAVDSNNIIWITSPIGLTRFDGSNWITYDTSNSPLIMGSSNYRKVTIDNKNRVWVSTIGGSGGGVARFDGVNWITYTTSNSSLPNNNITFTEFENDSTTWFGTIAGFVKKNNEVWTIFDTSNSDLPSNNIFRLGIEDTVKWIGTTSDGVVRYDNSIWTIFNTGNSPLPSNFISEVSIDAHGNKWIGGSLFSWLAKYDNSNWVIFDPNNSGLPSGTSVTRIFNSNYTKWIGTGSKGIVRYNDTTWVVYDPNNSQLPGWSVVGVAQDSNKNMWFATDEGIAVFNENGIVNISNQGTQISQGFELYQNYPNPFNPTTKIRFIIQRSTNIRLQVYTIQGKEVARLVNQKLNSGNYEYTFDGGGLPSGVYFYKLITDEYSQTKKMLLLK